MRGEQRETRLVRGQERLTWQGVKSTGKDAGFMLSEMGIPLKGFQEGSSVWLLGE